MIMKRQIAFALALMGLAFSISLSIPGQFANADSFSSNIDEANSSSATHPVVPVTGTNDSSNYHDAAWSPGTTENRKKVYLFSSGFPQNALAQYPSPPLEETTFWKMLDKEMASTSNLTLTSDPTKADYRVEMRCAGVFNCSRLVVDVKSPERNPLTSFSLTHINHLEGLGSPKLTVVSHELAQRLDERIRLLPQGGYGYSGD